MDYKKHIQEYIDLEREVLSRLGIDAINAVMTELESARQRRAAVYIFGNGGSGATASHIFNDFNRGLSGHLDEPWRFVCLSDNVATIMAIANDISYDAVFEFQLRGRLEPGDIIIAISGSGNSLNVLNAANYAKSKGARVIAFTGFDGGKLAEIADITLNVPVMSMQVTEDAHMIINHLMMAVFYKTLCGIDHIKGSAL